MSLLQVIFLDSGYNLIPGLFFLGEADEMKMCIPTAYLIGDFGRLFSALNIAFLVALLVLYPILLSKLLALEFGA